MVPLYGAAQIGHLYHLVHERENGILAAFCLEQIESFIQRLVTL